MMRTCTLLLTEHRNTTRNNVLNLFGFSREKLWNVEDRWRWCRRRFGILRCGGAFLARETIRLGEKFSWLPLRRTFIITTNGRKKFRVIFIRDRRRHIASISFCREAAKRRLTTPLVFKVCSTTENRLQRKKYFVARNVFLYSNM